MDISRFLRRQHPATYRLPTAYYTVIFDLPPETDIRELAHRLLKADVAKVAVSTADGTTSFGQRFSERSELHVRAAIYESTRDLVEGKTKLHRWALRHPLLFAYVLRHRMIKVSIRRSGGERDGSSTGSLDQLKQWVADSNKEMTDEGLFLNALCLVDRKIYKPAYLDDEPFIRLQLDPLIVASDLWNSDEVSILLLLHRSGTAMLTFIATLHDFIETDDLLRASMSSRVDLSQVIMPSSMANNVKLDDGRVESAEWINNEAGEKIARNIKWRGDGIPLQELFSGYGATVCAVAGDHRAFGEWICYTTVFIEGMDCCRTKSRWMRNHSHELAGLVRRDFNYASLKPSVVQLALGDEFGGYGDDSRYFEFGNAVIVSWNFGAPSGYSPMFNFHTLVVVESALIQYWQLKSLDQRLAVSGNQTFDLARAQQQIVLGLDEYRSSKLMAIEARKIEERITRGFDLDHIYARCLDRLNLVQQLLTARATQIANTRNMLLAAAAVAAAIVLGLPAVRDSLSVISSLDTNHFPGALARPLEGLAKSGAEGVWIGYLVLLFILVVFATAVFFVKRRNRPHPKKHHQEIGIPWSSIDYSLTNGEFRRGRPVDRDTEHTFAPD